jgi:hypothetical protein
VGYASFTNSPASTHLPAHSVAGSRPVPAGKGGRLAALLVLAASTEFLLVAVAAYCASVLYHRLILLDSPDVAYHPGIHSDFHIAVARFHRIPALFPDPDTAPARVPMERRQRRLLRILLLHLDDNSF